MIVDGTRFASDILSDVRASLRSDFVPVVRAIVVRPTAATESYLRIKEESARAAGMRLDVVRVSAEARDEEVIEAVTKEGADAVLVQLPLPEHFDTARILDAIEVYKDADVLSSRAYARFEAGEEGALIPPVALSVSLILDSAQISVPRKKAVVVGRGRLVGKPCAALLRARGAAVSVIHRSTEEPEKLLREADIIVSGIGVPRFITPEKIHAGVALIDAGTSGEGGGVVGDIDPSCAAMASVYTPVPGGVGPIAVACLFRNVATLISKR